jgi:hypothetical protein
MTTKSLFVSCFFIKNKIEKKFLKVFVKYVEACYRRAQTFKHPKLQKYSDLMINLIFTEYLVESVKCFDYLYFKPSKVRKIKNTDSKNTS